MDSTILSLHPGYVSYVNQAQEARAEAMARLAYGLVRGVDAAGVAAARLVRRAALAWHRRRERIETRALLRSLDDHLLADIGIDRAEIDGLAAAWARPEAASTPPAATVVPLRRLPAAAPLAKAA
jgi:uncharacterized protein YjiS (DUF1127 family)